MIKIQHLFVFTFTLLVVLALSQNAYAFSGFGNFSFSFGGFSFGFSFGSIGARGCGQGGLGDVLCNVVSSSSLVPGLFAGLSYLFGIVLGVMAIFKLKEHVEAPNNTQIWDPLKRFLAGGMFLALPTVLSAAANTVSAGLSTHSETAFNGRTSGLGLDAMLVNLIADVWSPAGELLGAFAYLAGIVVIMLGIARLLKTEQEGPRGPTGIGTIMTFLVGGALLSSDAIMGAFSNSFFGTSQVATFGVLNYNARIGMDPQAAMHTEAVISAVIGFVALIGWVSFLRGMFMLKGVADGNSQQASIMAAMTHLLGGALAVNLGPVINAVQRTLGIDALGLGVIFT